MALISPSGYDYEPSTVDKIKSSVAKRAPFVIGRLIQLIMYGIFQAAQFILQLFRDAFNR